MSGQTAGHVSGASSSGQGTSFWEGVGQTQEKARGVSSGSEKARLVTVCSVSGSEWGFTILVLFLLLQTYSSVSVLIYS